MSLLFVGGGELRRGEGGDLKMSSDFWKWKCPTFFNPMNCIVHQPPLSMGFSKQGYWNGQPFQSPGDLPDPGIEPGSSTLRADSLWSEPLVRPLFRPRETCYVKVTWGLSLWFQRTDLGLVTEFSRSRCRPDEGNNCLMLRGIWKRQNGPSEDVVSVPALRYSSLGT